MDENGFLKITDRKKDIIVTSGGKNIAPQNIENILNADQYINQIVVFGDGEKYVSALIVPEMDQLEQYALHHNITFDSQDELLHNKEIQLLIRQRIDNANKELADYERIKKFELLKDEFTLDKGELTPTMKIKRNVVMSHYKDLINKMYRRQ